MATMEFTVEWRSDSARHTDCLVAGKLNLGRDMLPRELEPQVLGHAPGHVARHRFAAGELMPEWMAEDHLTLPETAFHRRLRRYHYTEPRVGRFYPRAFIAGVRGILPENTTPFRVTALHDGFSADLNHPLAGRTVTVSARLLDTWQAGDAHGARCNDVAKLLTQHGVGMQSRWRAEPTDFFSDLPFTRMAPEADSAFYAKARLVDHLDRSATAQIESLYSRLIPAGARVLDLMTSWKSHLSESMELACVSGLGMNEEELQANPLLGERVIQDLNLDPELPFDDHRFDVAVCTVSVEYLTRPVEVFKAVRRVLKPGGWFILTFSNRWFPPKVVRVWQDVHEFERLGLVLEYFLLAGGFSELETFSMRGLPRPEDDKYADRLAYSDPVYAVWGCRQ